MSSFYVRVKKFIFEVLCSSLWTSGLIFHTLLNDSLLFISHFRCDRRVDDYLDGLVLLDSFFIQ